MMREVFDRLAPGGWIEYQDTLGQIQCLNGADGPAVTKWCDLAFEGVSEPSHLPLPSRTSVLSPDELETRICRHYHGQIDLAVHSVARGPRIQANREVRPGQQAGRGVERHLQDVEGSWYDGR